MDHSKCRITVLHSIYDDPDSEQVIYLIQCLVLVHHLLVYTEEMLHPPVYLCMDMSVFHMCGYFRHDLLNEFLSFRLPFIQILHQLVIDIRFPVFQRQIVQLCLDLGYTQTLCDGCVDIHRLPGLLLLLRRSHELQRPHIVQPVRQLDDDHPDILCHG